MINKTFKKDKSKIIQPTQFEQYILSEAKKLNQHQKNGFLLEILKSDFENLSLEFLKTNFSIKEDMIINSSIEHILKENNTANINFNPFEKKHSIPLINSLSPIDKDKMEVQLIKKSQTIANKFIYFDNQIQNYLTEKFPKLYKKILPYTLNYALGKGDKNVFSRLINLEEKIENTPIQFILSNFILTSHISIILEKDFGNDFTQSTFRKHFITCTQDFHHHIYKNQNPLTSFDPVFDFDDESIMKKSTMSSIKLLGKEKFNQLYDEINTTLILFNTFYLDQNLNKPSQDNNPNKPVKKI